MAAPDALNIRPSTGDTISQDEVESLLAQMAGGENPGGVIEQSWTPPGVGEVSSTHRHEFRQFSSFSAVELRKLRVRHEDFGRSLAARLSIYLRLEVTIQMAKLETTPFCKFVETLPNPTHVTSIRLDPLQGTCLLDMPPRLGMCIVDRELGGPGVSLEDTRELSQIEARLLTEVVGMMINEWCSAWSDILDLRPEVLGHENNGRFLQTSEPEDIVLVVGVEIKIGEVIEQVSLAFPYTIIEPVMAKLNAEKNSGKKAETAKPAKANWNTSLETLRIPLTAELSNLVLTAGELVKLKPGDVLPLNADMASQVKVCLGKVPKFMGVLGVAGQNSAVRITRVLRS